jgi:hypothetical protein
MILTETEAKVLAAALDEAGSMRSMKVISESAGIRSYEGLGQTLASIRAKVLPANARLMSPASELLSACRLMAGILGGFTAAELKARVNEIHAESFDEAQEALWAAMNKAAGE